MALCKAVVVELRNRKGTSHFMLKSRENLLLVTPLLKGFGLIKLQLACVVNK